MSETKKRLKLVYITPALYMAGGVERVLTLKANYFVEHFNYDITIILTEGKGKPLFYQLSDKINVINLDINFEELWNCSFVKKFPIYVKKQRRYKKLLTDELMRLKPDITVSLLRREINFLTTIKDGSHKVGELHVNRANYRTFNGFNPFKQLFSKLWMMNLVKQLRRLDKFVVLTDIDRKAWKELNNVVTIPNPLSFMPAASPQTAEKRVIAVGRYSYEKGIDLLLQAWAMVQSACPDWSLAIFGDGDRTTYQQMMNELKIDPMRCVLNGRTSSIQDEYAKSSLSVCSSRFEGFGMVILEAMACGLPVVSFDCPWGPRSVITDGENGILVENGNVVMLAKALRHLMEDDELRHTMARAAKDNTPWFQIDYVAEMWRTLFQDLTKF